MLMVPRPLGIKRPCLSVFLMIQCVIVWGQGRSLGLGLEVLW